MHFRKCVVCGVILGLSGAICPHAKEETHPPHHEDVVVIGTNINTNNSTVMVSGSIYGAPSYGWWNDMGHRSG